MKVANGYDARFSQLQCDVSAKIMAAKKKDTDQAIKKMIASLNQRAVFNYTLNDSDTGKACYRIADTTIFQEIFNTLQRCLSPQAYQLLVPLKRVIEGYYTFGKEFANKPIAHVDLQCASAVLVSDVNTVLTPLIRNYVGPSIVEVNSAGYHLLNELVTHHANVGKKYINLLNKIRQQDKRELLIALRDVLQNKYDFSKTDKIKVGQSCISLEEFVKMLALSDIAGEHPILTEYLNQYDGSHERHWMIVAATAKQNKVVYIRRRIAYLLHHNDFDALNKSACADYLRFMVKKCRKYNEEIIGIIDRYIFCVIIDINNVLKIDSLVGGIGTLAHQQAWTRRRNIWLYQTICNVVYDNTSKEVMRGLQSIVEAHPNWLSPDRAPDYLQLIYHINLDGWNLTKHTIISRLQDKQIHVQYNLKFLYKVLLDKSFAYKFMYLLPKAEDWEASYDLIGAASFRTLCEDALLQIESASDVTSYPGIKVLHDLLHGHAASVLNMQDLAARVSAVNVRYEQENNIEQKYQQLQLHISSRQHVFVKKVINDLSLDYMAAASVQNTIIQQRLLTMFHHALVMLAKLFESELLPAMPMIAQDITALLQPLLKSVFADKSLANYEWSNKLESIEARLAQKIIGLLNKLAALMTEYSLQIETGAKAIAANEQLLSMLTRLPQVISVRRLQFCIQHPCALKNIHGLPQIVMLFEQELLRFNQGEQNHLDNLPVLLEAIELKNISLQKNNALVLCNMLETTLLHPNTKNLSKIATVGLAKLKHYVDWVGEMDLPLDTVVANHMQLSPSDSIDVYSSPRAIYQKIIEFRHDSPILMKALFTKGMAVSKRDVVMQYLMDYFAEKIAALFCHFTREKALIDLMYLQEMMRQSGLSELPHPFIFLAMKNSDYYLQLKVNYSKFLSAIEGHKVIYKLNFTKAMLILIEQNILPKSLSTKYKAKLNQLLAGIKQGKLLASPQILAILQCWQRVFSGNAAPGDRNLLQQYEQATRDYTIAKVAKTATVRLSSSHSKPIDCTRIQLNRSQSVCT